MMRLNHTPPKGAGKVQHVTLTDKLLKVIDNLGNDKYGNPVGIRSPELAAASGVPAKSITALLATAVTKGRVVVCKITIPGASAQNEYRKGGGLPPPEFVPLNTKRAGIALHGTPKPPSTRSTPLSTPLPAAAAIQTPTFLKPTQPEVVAPSAETSAAGDVANPPPVVPAVAAQATPKPEARARMKKEPAAPKASAGDVRIGINDAGTLVIAIDDDSIELNPKQAKRLGYFMAGTAGVWNPF
jgi:hypothetical protein